MADNYFFPAIGFTGGGDGDLDTYPIADIHDGDGAIVIVAAGAYTYRFDDSSTEAEDSPTYIRPDDYVDGGVWCLINFAPDEFDVSLHAAEHLPGQGDPIALATTSADGLMPATDKFSLAQPWAFKNAIINGDFRVFQRGASASSGGGYVSADRWKFSYSGTSADMSGFQSTIDPEAILDSDSKRSWRITTTAGETAGSYTIFSQNIEGANRFSDGWASLSFWAYCTTDKKLAVTARQVFGTGGSPSASENFHSTGHIVDVTSAWTKYTMMIPVPSVSGKTFGTALDDYLAILFWTGAGSDFEAAPYEITMGNLASVIYIADVQLEKGSVVTPFERRPEPVEELLCYRYYWRKNPGQHNFQSYAANAIMSWRHAPPVRMRAVPTATSSWTSVALTRCNTPTWTVGLYTYDGGILYATGDQTTVNAVFTPAAANYIALSAEL